MDHMVITNNHMTIYYSYSNKLLVIGIYISYMDYVHINWDDGYNF